MFGKHVVRRANLIRVARQIEPMPRPAFAEGFGLEQPIHHSLVSLRRRVGREAGDVLRSWGQASEIKRDTTQPSVSIRIRRRLQAARFELREDEAIHWITCPRDILYSGRCRVTHRLKGPELPALLEVDDAGRLDGRLTDSRIRRTNGHPLLQHFDLARRKLPLRRHFHLGIRVAHGLDQMALHQVTWHDGRAAITTGLPARLEIQREATLDLRLMRVALVAALLQQR